MYPWQLAFLGQREFPRDLTTFEIEYFFSFDNAEHQVIRTRRRKLNQLGAALHLGFMKMTGRALGTVNMVPRNLLIHLGNELNLDVPTLTSVRALYRRRSTMFEHQKWAAATLGFTALTEGHKRALTRSLKQEFHNVVTRPQLHQYAKRWLYEHKRLIPRERVLVSLVRAASQHAEKDMLAEVEAAIPTSVRLRWLNELSSQKSRNKSILEWLLESPGKASKQTLESQLAYIDYLKDLDVHQHTIEPIHLEHQRHYAERIRRRRPSRWEALGEPRRTLEATCFMRVTLMQKVDIAIALLGREILKLRRDTAERVQSTNAELGSSLRSRVRDLQLYALDKTRTADELRNGIFELLPTDNVPTFPTQAAELRYRMSDDARPVRRLVRSMLKLDYESTANNGLLTAIATLSELHRRGLSKLPHATDSGFAPLWSFIIDGDDRVRALRAFEAAVLFELRKCLRNGSVWVPYSLSYRNRDALLITSKHWKKSRKRYYSRLNLPRTGNQFVARYTKALERGLKQVAAAAETGAINLNQGELGLSALEAEVIPGNVEQVRDALFRDIGNVQFPELIMEIDSHTRFSQSLLGREPQSRQELLTVYGALLAHGTDMTATGVSLMMPGIESEAISQCMQLLEDGAALRNANNAVVAFMRRHNITRAWGEGSAASSDSMSLDATRHLFSARIDPRRRRYAVGIYTHKLDQWPLIYDQPVVLLQRQSGMAIEGALRQTASQGVERLAVDTHGFTAFGMAVRIPAENEH